MSTATRSDWTLPLVGGRNYFLLRRVHSLTGLIFSGYFIVHLLVNATIAQAGESYQIQVRKIHELPLLWAVEWLLIFLPIIYHILYGIWITVTGQPNVNSYPYTKNWMYLMQRISAVVIVLFMIFHVLSLKYHLFGNTLSFEPNRASYTIARHMQASPVLAWVVYPIGVLASCFHLANGLWTAAVTWGVTISAGSQRRWGFCCVGIFFLTLLLGMVAIVAASRANTAVLQMVPPAFNM